MKNLIISFIVTGPLLLGCIEDYDFQMQDAKPLVVVDALITNQPGPYYVRLTYSRVGESKPYEQPYIDIEEPVLNATIIISDDHGQIDTLIPNDFKLEDYIYDSSLGYIKFIYNNGGQVIDTIFLNEPSLFSYDRGFYKTKTIIGLPNRLYKLHIIADGEEYTAQDYMMEVPKIDSLTFEKRISEFSGGEYYVPLLNFKEPQNEKNYYLIQIGNELQNRMFVKNRRWTFSILSDKYLETYVSGLVVDDGASPDGIEFYEQYFYGTHIEISMSSISENVFNYYNNLLKQFENDGGVYKPTPASPPTNISNGGLGLFRASATTTVLEDTIGLK